jgi:SAM-dependent methyltransferase
MNHFLHGVARAVAETFDLAGPIVEIGSYQVEGQEAIADLRRLFAGKPYTGLDRRLGPGVDLFADVEDLPQADQSVGTVLAMNTFEHVPRFWRGFAEIRRVLRPDGALLVSCPFHFKIHNYPADYWRFTPAALELLLEDYPSRIVGWHGPVNRPAHVWALAFGEERPPITAAQFERYRTLLRRYAHEPQSWFRRLRYRLGSLFFGRGPFSSYLDQERWETICRMPNVQSWRRARPESTTERPASSMSRSASPTGTAATCSADACNR